MDSRATPMDIMAEAVRINAGVWAKEIEIATGKNEVQHHGAGIGSVSSIEDASSGVSLDVAAVGGMYANTIKLIGTQKGLGVNHEGIIAADTIEILQDGTVCNKGAVMGKNITVEAENLSNLAAADETPALMVASDGLTVKAGTLHHADGSILYSKDAMHITADVLHNQEHAVLRSNGNMEIHAGELHNRSAIIEAAGDMNITAKALYNINAHVASEMRVSRVESITEYAGSGDPVRYPSGTPGVWVYNNESDHLHTPSGNHEEWSRYDYTRTIENSVITKTDPSQIYAGGHMEIHGDTLRNEQSSITSAGTLNLQAAKVENIDFIATQKIHDSGSVTNFWRHHRKGRDSTGSNTNAYTPSDCYTSYEIETTELTANSAKELADFDIKNQTAPSCEIAFEAETNPAYADYKKWMVSDYMTRYLGVDVDALNRRIFDNSAAKPGISGRAVNLHADSIYNSGKLYSRDTLEISTGNIENTGRIRGNDIVITADGDILNHSGSILAENRIALHAQNDIVNQASLHSNGNETENHTNIFSKGRIETTGKNSTITMQAGNTIAVSGSTVRASGENASLTMHAQQVNMGTVEETSHEHTTWSEGNTRNVSSTMERGSDISAAGNLQIQAEDTVSLHGSRMAGTNIDLSAELYNYSSGIHR